MPTVGVTYHENQRDIFKYLLMPYCRVANLRLASHMRGLRLASCGSYTHIEVCVSNICLLPLSSIRYIRVRGKNGGGPYVSSLVLLAYYIQ